MVQLFTIALLYTQLLVGQPGSAGTGLLWSEAEVAQGFAWDPELVAFGVPDHDGECLVAVETERAGPFVPEEDALWAVSVPFEAREAAVEVGTVLGDPRRFPIRPGSYQLVFQARPGGAAHAYRLEVIFIPDEAPGFAVLKQGELESGAVISRRARRA